MTIQELILDELGLAPVFEKYGIDYSCDGHTSLEAVCKAKGLDAKAVANEVEFVRKNRPYQEIHPSLWDLEFLIDYIIRNHHTYLRESIPVLTAQLQKLDREEGLKYPFVKQILMLFTRTVQGFEVHMRKEEMLLFPYIKSLESAKEVGRPKPRGPLLSLEDPLSNMHKHHEETVQAFAKIRALLKDYVVPNGASPAYQAVVSGMRDFETDIRRHLHLENNILFERAVELERSFDLKI